MEINLTTTEKKILLKNYLSDDICFKAIIDTLDDVQLNGWIDKNLDEMLIGGLF